MVCFQVFAADLSSNCEVLHSLSTKMRVQKLDITSIDKMSASVANTLEHLFEHERVKKTALVFDQMNKKTVFKPKDSVVEGLSQDHGCRILELFTVIDTDGSGIMERAEVWLVHHASADRMVDDLLHPDKLGEITLEQWQQFMIRFKSAGGDKKFEDFLMTLEVESIQHQREVRSCLAGGINLTLSNQQTRRAQLLFESADFNQDGVLSVHELSKVHTGAKKLLKSVKHDANGNVTNALWVDLFSSIKQLYGDRATDALLHYFEKVTGQITTACVRAVYEICNSVRRFNC